MLCDDYLHYRSLPTKFHNLNFHFIKQEKRGWSSMMHLWIHLMMNPIPSHLEYPSLHFKANILRVTTPKLYVGRGVRPLLYEKKCTQLRTQDANGAEPFTIERTRATIRNLRTKLNITIAFVKDVSRRVVAVCDDSSKCWQGCGESLAMCTR
ncbi:uncharacterized protein LOC119329843 [Triticum dicoccoides]|uniref:uncharacterized protein LOC119329843 n=1 Tax=Triticum dicoccoides TaxID=85692 RepID=UPI0018917411|nr:uncharacterized protein LOC119329843 [Triticum dicoccoides]